MDSFIRTESNRDFLSIMILPPSVAIEIENGGDFATLAYIKQFQLSGLILTLHQIPFLFGIPSQTSSSLPSSYRQVHGGKAAASMLNKQKEIPTSFFSSASNAVRGLNPFKWSDHACERNHFF